MAMVVEGQVRERKTPGKQYLLLLTSRNKKRRERRVEKANWCSRKETTTTTTAGDENTLREAWRRDWNPNRPHQNTERGQAKRWRIGGQRRESEREATRSREKREIENGRWGFGDCHLLWACSCCGIVSRNLSSCNRARLHPKANAS